MKCVVAGASGFVGDALVAILLEEDRYSQVVSLVRRPLGRVHAKLAEAIVDFDREESITPHLAGAGDVFCCLGTTIKVAGSQEAFRKVDHDYPLALARAAHAAGCKQFLIVTAVGASAGSKVFYNRVKGELEAALKQIEFPDGLKIFQPSMLLGPRKESRPAEAVGRAVFSATRGLFRGGLTQYRGIYASELARAMATAARTPTPGAVTYAGVTLFALTRSR